MSNVIPNVTLTAANLKDQSLQQVEHEYTNSSRETTGASSSSSSSGSQFSHCRKTFAKSVRFRDHVLKDKDHENPELGLNPLTRIQAVVDEVREDVSTIRGTHIPIFVILLCIIFFLSVTLYVLAREKCRT